MHRDEMGLGKTVQMIATMVVNGPTSDRERSSSRTTLIVVPAALLSQVQSIYIVERIIYLTEHLQWKEEIDSKTNDLFRVHVHHGKDKLKNSRDFGKYDVSSPSPSRLAKRRLIG